MAYGTKLTKAQIEQLAAAHETGAAEDETAEWAVDTGANATGTTTMTIRLPVKTVAALKIAAETQGVGATVLAGTWIKERLAQSELATDPSATVKVADLLSFMGGNATVSGPGGRIRTQGRHGGIAARTDRQAAAKTGRKNPATSLGRVAAKRGSEPPPKRDSAVRMSGKVAAKRVRAGNFKDK